MVQNAPLILLDEPFTAIDQDTETELLSLIGDWATEGRAVILVLHDLSAVLKYCNLALLLGDGQALFGNPREILAPRNLIRHKYLSKSRVDWMHDMYAQGGGKIV